MSNQSRQPDYEKFVMNVIWTAEKYFYLNQTPHKQNDDIWSSDNPHEIVESNNCNDEKFRIFVAIVYGKAPIVHHFVDENGTNVIVNGTC